MNSCSASFTCFFCHKHFQHSLGIVKEHPINHADYGDPEEISLCDSCSDRFQSDWLLKYGINYPYTHKNEMMKECPPHEWDRDGEKCLKCGDKDWM